MVTLNLVDIALSSGGNLEKFWKIFDERLELCYRALMCRHEPAQGDPFRRSPHFVAVRRLRPAQKGGAIDKLLVGGYSTIPWDTPAFASASAT